MKTRVVLLSDQHIPNLLSVHHFKPERLYIVESALMKRTQAAARLLEALKIGGLDYDSRHSIVPVDDVAQVSDVTHTMCEHCAAL